MRTIFPLTAVVRRAMGGDGGGADGEWGTGGQGMGRGDRWGIRMEEEGGGRGGKRRDQKGRE